MPSSRARSSARADSSSAISLCTWASAARTLAPAELVMTYDPGLCTYTITNRAPCLRASPAAYDARPRGRDRLIDADQDHGRTVSA